MKHTSRPISRSAATIAISILFCFSLTAIAQTEDPDALKARAAALFEAQKFTEALPLYEKLVVQFPKDSLVFRNFGFALIGQAANTADSETRRQLRIRARDAFMIARDLGDKSLLVAGLIEGLPPDGRDGQGYSDNAAANKAMQKGEALFSSGQMNDAFKAYQEALTIDPRCYYAALFSGDVKLQTNNYDEAETWYQRAISIDPYKETAYRYSATPLMKQGKTDAARDRYVEAYITSPYDKLAVSGIVQWAQATKTQLRHPKIDVPEITIGPDGKQHTTINISPGQEDGSMAWMSYAVTRESWEKEKFAKAYPKEAKYRHSLAEEADALRSVVSFAKSLKPKKLNDQIAMLEKLDKDGVLEAYILLARADNGIAQDHYDYLRKNRDKLKLYVTKYVLHAA
jgi:tetratricopeptide (TPR) repeat protein